MSAPNQMERIGRYQVLERVGKGGMGVLYRGFDPVLDREVAIKLMLTDFTDDTEQMRPRFYTEARAAAKLNHPKIVTIFEFAEESNVPYIVMEFLRGTPLGARMTSQPPLSTDDKLNIVAQLCDGLAYAHEQGVVHRDVKPDNVFILEDGSVKLLDFGIAKLTSSNLTRQGDVLGSASYMSPEQVGGSDSVDGRADGKMGEGAVMHCAHGKERLDFEIVDWRPFETVSMDLRVPLGAVVRSTLELTKAPGGVNIKIRLKPIKAPLLARPLLMLASRQVENSDKKSAANLTRVVNEDLASGKVERWQPELRAS